MFFTQVSVLLDAIGSFNDGLSPVLTTAAVALFIGVVAFKSVGYSNYRNHKHPPRVWFALPFIGSAVEFGTDCRAFLKKYFERYQTPIFTANIAGKDFHFVDTSYEDFSPERLFRSPALQFRPMANDAMLHGFGTPPDVLRRINGHDGEGETINKIYHSYLMKSDGLSRLLEKAQERLHAIVFSDPSLYPQAVGEFATVPLFALVQESLFRATIGSTVSESIVLEDSAVASLREFNAFDEKFPLLVAKLPSWLFPDACRGRSELITKCQGPAYEKGLSPMIRERDAAAKAKLGVEPHELSLLSMPIVWAASANTMPTGFWLIYETLKQRNTVYQALQKEVDQFFQARKTDSQPLSLVELEGLVGIDSAFQESLRIYSESMIAREVVHDVEVDLGIFGPNRQFYLKKNSRVAVMMSTLHMDERIFSNAKTFQWDRFRPDPSTGKAPVFRKNGKTLTTPVRAFGGGVSMCPGRNFAKNEIKAFVAELLHQFDLELAEDTVVMADLSRAGLGINPPQGDIKVRITRRF